MKSCCSVAVPRSRCDATVASSFAVRTSRPSLRGRIESRGARFRSTEFCEPRSERMSPSHNAAEPLQDLIDESLDEATFLLRRWESELTSLTRNLDEVYSWTEDRLHGALDGIRVAGAGVVDVATKAMLTGEIDQVTVSTGVLASSADRAATEAFGAALAVAEGEQLAAMVRGLQLLGSDPALR